MFGKGEKSWGSGKKIYKSKINLGWSKTLDYTKDWKWRIDIETMWGKWNVHIQDMKNSTIKYYYDYEKGIFVDKFWNQAPKSIQKLKNNEIIKKWLKKARDLYLDIK